MFRINWEEIQYSSRRFGLWRAAFGFYLAYYYARVFPYAAELYGREGAFPDAYLSARSFYPLALLRLDSTLFAQVLIALAVVCSILVMCGYQRRIAALIILFTAAWMYNRNFFTDSPDWGFTSWLVFALIVIPSGEEFSLGPKKATWHMPKSVYWCAWIVLVLGYFLAGTSKLRVTDAGWLDGTALYYVLTTDNTRLEWYRGVFDNIPLLFFWPVTYGVLFLQALAPLFTFFKSGRFLWWLGMTATHVVILIFINLPQVTWGMLLFHAFIWDSSWNAVFERWWLKLYQPAGSLRRG